MQALRSSCVLAILVAGCATNEAYIYSPEGATRWSDGRPAAVSMIPPEAPQGDVQVSSFGITELTPDGASPVEALHVRMIVTNNGDELPWTIDTREVLVDVAREGRSRALFVNTDIATLPIVEIGRGQRRTLDFYFPVPANVDDEEDMPAFDVLWQVNTNKRPFASRTAFRALERYEDAAASQVVLVSGWGPYWWYNPLWYPGPVYLHHRPLVIRRPPSRVTVSRPPRWHYTPAPRDHRRRR